MRMTLLEIVQSILSSMDSDEVDSISDTPEAQQVAGIVKDTYFYLLSSIDAPKRFGLFELNTSDNSNKPTLMTLPSNVKSVEWIKYNIEETSDTSGDNFFLLTPRLLVDFLLTQNGMDISGDNVGEMTFTSNSETHSTKYWNDRHPTFYTSFDDHTILFDAYNADEDTTLQKSKTMCWGEIIPDLVLEDDTIPDLDPEMFSLLLNEAKRECFVELKQSDNNIAEKRARKGWIRQQYRKNSIKGVPYYDTLPIYGRK